MDTSSLTVPTENISVLTDCSHLEDGSLDKESRQNMAKNVCKCNESANVDVSEGPSGMKNTDGQVIGGESHVKDKTHEGKYETSFTTDHENEKTYTMEIDNDASVTENPQESILNGSKRSSILSPSLLFNMFLEKYSDVKPRRHNQPRR